MRNSARLPTEEVAAISPWTVLMRSWLRVLIVAGFAGAAVYTALALTPARYVATAVIRVPTPAGSDAVASRIAALQSQEFARKVVTDLDLARSPAFNGAHAVHDIRGWLDRLSGRNALRKSGSPEEQIAAALVRSLEVAPGSEDGSIAIRVTARTPDLAVRIADRLADLHSASPQPAPSDARATEMSRLETAVAAIDAEIARLKSLADGTADAQRRHDLKEALTQAERERADASSRANTARGFLDKGAVEAIAELQTSPSLHQLIAERVRAEVQKNSAERSLPADHPRIRDLRARLSELRWQMFREATAITEGLEAELKTATGREAEARARLAGADSRAEAPSATIDTDRLVALESDAAEKRAALASLTASQLTTASATPTARSRADSAVRLSPSQAIAIPAFPRKAQLSLLTAVSILMIGFVAVILRTLLAGNRRSVVEAGFADMATTARDRADVDLGTSSLRVQPFDARETALPSTAELSAPDVAIHASAATELRAAEPGQFVILSTTTDAARHLAGRAMGRKGYRTLLVADGIDGAAEARDMVSSLATAGRRSVLVDWSRDGKGLAASLGIPVRPGMCDLLDGRASFDDVIVRLPESEAHVIAAGAPPANPELPLDADWINLVLDALDEAYDHIVVVAQIDEARALFETIEGRFDAGIVMADRRAQGSTINAGPGVFLGFEVTEIYIVQMDLAQRRGAARRLKRTRRQAAA
jgi:succinoglycan biosynthesis transport protein ExoP